MTMPSTKNTSANKAPREPRMESLVHGLTVAKAHGTDKRFTTPRLREANRLAGKTSKIAWTACGCDICVCVRRWNDRATP